MRGFWALSNLACKQTRECAEQRFLNCISYRGCGLQVREARVEQLVYFSGRQTYAQHTISWEGKGVSTPFLQGYRHHPQWGTSAEQPCQVQESPAGCISSRGRKRNSKQGLSKCLKDITWGQDRELKLLLSSWSEKESLFPHLWSALVPAPIRDSFDLSPEFQCF